jgi:hypothetical protein
MLGARRNKGVTQDWVRSPADIAVAAITQPPTALYRRYPGRKRVHGNMRIPPLISVDLVAIGISRDARGVAGIRGDEIPS